jgi:hypothetical protein
VGNAKFNVQVRSLLREAGYELVRTLKASGMHTEHEPIHTQYIQPYSPFLSSQPCSTPPSPPALHVCCSVPRVRSPLSRSQVWAAKMYDNVFLRPEHFLQGPTGTAPREMPPAALELLRQPYAHRKGVGPIHSTYKRGRWPSAGAYVLDGVKDECAAVPHASERSHWC